MPRGDDWLDAQKWPGEVSLLGRSSLRIATIATTGLPDGR